MTPILPRHIADQLARTLVDAVRGMGGNPTQISIEARDTGLLVTMTMGGKTVAAVLPPGYNVEYHDMAATLLQEHAMLIAQPEVPRTIFAD